MSVLEKSNRLDYGLSLAPDEGWTTSWAIGTTYSLDLNVLLNIPLALFHGKYLSENSDVNNLRSDMLDALNKVKDRMFIFVHENNIHAKCKFSTLIGFIDQSIWPFKVETAYLNFHPKLWLVRYEKNNDKQTYKYRLIVMSRNITDATDFDIAVTMDSDAPSEEHHDNDSLQQMVVMLMKRTGQTKIINQIKKELKGIRFMAPYPFDKRAPKFFHHSNKYFTSPLISDDKYKELLVISPFIDNYSLERLSRKTETKPILISRELELDKCKPEVLEKWDCYQWNNMLEEASDYEENERAEDESKPYGINLHAKIFIAKEISGRKNNWFVGSANCTRAGLEKNHEAMLQLSSNNEDTSPQNALETLLPRLITKYTPKEKVLQQEDGKEQMREIVFDLSQLTFKSQIIKDTNGRYAMEVAVESREWKAFIGKYQGIKITMQLFASDLDRWIITKECCHKFKPLLCQQLSPFVSITIKSGEEEKKFLLKLPLEMPDERLGHIMAEILDNEEKIMRYFMFCLDPLTDKEQQKIGSGITRYNSHISKEYQDYSLPIYEKLLLSASRNRAALAEIDKSIKQLKNTNGKDGKPLLSESFKDMWKLFAAYIK